VRRHQAGLALAALLLVGCSGDEGDRAEPLRDATVPSLPAQPTTTTSPSAPSTTSAPDTITLAPVTDLGLEFRPVLEVAPPPCGRRQLEDKAGDQCYGLGRTAVDETDVESARAVLDPTGSTWQVALELLAGDPGIDRFNRLAARCFAQQTTCPTGQVAVVLDQLVLSAPTVQIPSFERDAIVISGDFTRREARHLAQALGT
jgi:preprotein translocase subunit SecD